MAIRLHCRYSFLMIKIQLIVTALEADRRRALHITLNPGLKPAAVCRVDQDGCVPLLLSRQVHTHRGLLDIQTTPSVTEELPTRPDWPQQYLCRFRERNSIHSFISHIFKLRLFVLFCYLYFFYIYIYLTLCISSGDW